MKIGIIREGKIPPDRRVPIAPKQCRRIREKYPQVKLVLQSSPIRTFMDEEYEEQCFQLQDDVTDCDALLGIKEVPIDELIEGKTYFFFSHTTKKQPHNKELLKAILDKKITLIDYELLTDDEGNRLVGFGRFAGLVGAYNGFRGIAIRNDLKEPKPAHTLNTIEELKEEAKKLKVPPVKIAFTGNGRVAGGVRELLESMNIKEVDVETYLNTKEFSEPVFVQLEPSEYNIHKEGKDFYFDDFVENPGNYKSNFKRFCSTTDFFIMSAFWDPLAPRLFTNYDILENDFRIKVIADITCDIEGALPVTLRYSTREDPFYGYNAKSGKEELAFTNPDTITVMAVDNLPNELAKEASKYFGNILIEQVLPAFIENQNDKMIERATIAKDGVLMPQFSYLQAWID